MPLRPFWFTDTITLAANASGSLNLPVSAGEKARFKRAQFIATGVFQINDIRDSSGQRYSNASTNDPIPSTALNDAATDFSGISRFEPPLELEGPLQLLFDILDTSAAPNTVRVIVEAEKET